MNNNFHTASGSPLGLDGVVSEILAYIGKEPERRYKVVIGTDSENHEGSDFVSAVVVLRLGNGGRYFWIREHLTRSYPTLRDRIYDEALRSIELGRAFLEELRRQTPRSLPLEIHVDIGENGETRSMIQEVVGMVRGSGFVVAIKPSAYAASHVADRHV